VADPLGVLVELFLALAKAAVMLVDWGAGRGLAVAEATRPAVLEVLVRRLRLALPVARVLALFGFVAMLLLLRAHRFLTWLVLLVPTICLGTGAPAEWLEAALEP
jgi:hypothetical protein